MTLKEETLKPAENEALLIVENAKDQAKKIIQEARKEAESILTEANNLVDKKQKQLKVSLMQAGKRTIEVIKQSIEKKIFNETLNDWIEGLISSADVASKIIAALFQALEEKGLEGSVTAYIGKNISPREVNALLGKKFLNKFQNKSVKIGDFLGGVQLHLNDKKWIIDASDKTLVEIMCRYLQKDFRDMVFEKNVFNGETEN